MTREVADLPQPFYASVFDAADLVAASKLEGVDDELAALRVTLRDIVKEQRENYELMLKCAALVVRAAGARYRMSAKSKDELASAMAAVIEGVGVQLMPEEAVDV